MMVGVHPHWRKIFTLSSTILSPGFYVFVILFLGAFPLAFILFAGTYAEKHIHSNGSILARLSPTGEIAWQTFLTICGFLTTILYLYYVDDITSTPEARSRRKWWPSWLGRKLRRKCTERNGNDRNPPSPPISNCSAEQLEWVGINSQAVVAPMRCLDASKERASIFAEHLDNLPALSTVLPAEIHQQAEEEPVLEQNPSLYHTTTPSPGLAEHTVSTRTNADPTHETSDPSTGILKYFTIYSMFMLCFIPLILSIFTQNLVRDSVYQHACNEYDWEVVLNTINGLNMTTSNILNPPTATFRNLNETDLQGTTQSFTMWMSLGVPAPKTLNSQRPRILHRRQAPSSQYNKNDQRIAQNLLNPIKDGVLEYDHFFRLLPGSVLASAKPRQRNSDTLLSLVAYDTPNQIYHGTYDISVNIIRPRETIGNYRTESNYRFPILGIHQAHPEAHDHFGFPRVVLKNSNGVVLQTTRNKRGKCTEMKVCMRGMTAAEATIVVGPLLIKHVEAAKRCKRRHR